METERIFLDALRRMSRWNIVGTQLEVYDGSGSVLARFEGLHM